MPKAPRKMRLTEHHVRLVHRDVPEDDEAPIDGLERATPEDHRVTIERMLADHPDPRNVWVFAYGSLIWKPACDVVEVRTGLLRGWHRAFCLGWNTRFRGSRERPGLMLALDRGGACNGVLCRLPPDAIEASLHKLFEREMGWKPTPFPPRWVSVRSGEGAVRALTFCIDRDSGRYVTGLADEQIADVLAHAVGSRGSMAEYLHATVAHLQQMGIHDTHLWALQELVAARIEAVHTTTGADK